MLTLITATIMEHGDSACRINAHGAAIKLLYNLLLALYIFWAAVLDHYLMKQTVHYTLYTCMHC